MTKVSQALEKASVGIAEVPTTTHNGAFGRASHDSSIIKLYYTIEALKPENAKVVLQFVASTSGEGTTTIASGFAAVAASEGNQAVLLIDCNPSGTRKTGGPTLVEARKNGIPLQETFTPSNRAGNLQTAQLSNSPNPLIEIDSADFIRLLDDLRGYFGTIVLDCAAATEAPDSVAISRYCDGTILVVRAEWVRPVVIQSVQNNIRLVGGQIIGVAFNRRRTYIPNWLYSRLFSATRRDPGKY
jgi:Mrp family chromosome partitioning ATPase